MHIKTTSGSGAGALGIIGTGLALALPDAKWIGWTLVVVGLLVFVFDIHIERGQLTGVGSTATLKQRFKRMWPQYLMMICGIGFFVGLIAFLQLNVTPPSKENSGQASSSERPPSMLEYFAHNHESFPTASKQETDTTLTFADGRTLTIKSDLFRDSLARTTFMAFYIPNSSPLAFNAILGLADGYKQIMHDMMSSLVINGAFGHGSSMVTQDELTFTGRIFIYHEGPLTLQERAEADTLYKSKHLGVQFRGMEELMNKWIADKQSKKH